MNKRHGMSLVNGKRPAEYQAWRSMKLRCYNKNTASYHSYGGRGITVCPEWVASFTSFYADVGPRPGPEYSLDRIDNDRPYEPGNCRWATATEQANNRRVRMRICRKTDALLLSLAPQLHSMGFSMRNIAALFSVGKTTIEQALGGKFDKATVVDGDVYVIHNRKVRRRRAEPYGQKGNS